MLPQFYQDHLKSQLQPAQFLLLTLVVKLLQSTKQAKLEFLASHLPLPMLFESRRRKLQRFLGIPTLSIETLWFPIVTWWLQMTFGRGQTLYLVVDRTRWMEVNLLVLSVVWGHRAWPVYWCVLQKKGNSNFAEQTQALSRVLPLFNGYDTVVLGDREFCSVRLARWFKRMKLSFCLRLKANEYIEMESELLSQLSELGLCPGMQCFFQGVRVTKGKGFGQFNVAAKWQQKRTAPSPTEPWYILTNLGDLSTAIDAYKMRFSIEEMFRDFKAGGYNLEGTNVTGTHLTALVMLIAIAYTSAALQGQSIKQKGIQKYVGRVKEPGRVVPRHSHFYIGLHGQAWVQFMADCSEIVDNLLLLSPHKRPYYKKGRRAMELIGSVF
jgi:Transposase DDE domain